MFLLDGSVAGTWKLQRCGREKNTAVVEISPFEALSDADAAALGTEAQALLAFAAPEAADWHIRIAAVR